jgi:hypothetical protein
LDPIVLTPILEVTLLCSLDGEAFPGVYLPGKSRWSLSVAKTKYLESEGKAVATLVELNEYVLKKFPLVLPAWNPASHISTVPPFTRDLSDRLGLPLRPLGIMAGRGSRESVPYVPYSWATARTRVNVHSILKPLEPFLADPLLTTVVFGEEMSQEIKGLSLKCPDGSGYFVARTKMCNQTQATNIYVTKNTKIERCGYCSGLYLLPSHCFVMCFYVPKNLKNISGDIIAIWANSTIKVCAVHFLHRSEFIPNRVVSQMRPNV